MTLIVHAPNIHQGGGKTLLLGLLASLPSEALCVLDERLVAGMKQMDLKCIVVSPSILSRLLAEFRLRQVANDGDAILCFGNLPPLFPTRGKVVVFLQNRYLFGHRCFAGFSLAARLRLYVERAWFRWRMRSCYQIVVQSLSMQSELKDSLGLQAVVTPFLPVKEKREGSPLSVSQESQLFDFVYVSSAEPHKNHENLLNAWVMLAQQDVRPHLALTVCERSSPAVARMIHEKTHLHRLNIRNFGALKHGEVLALYDRSSALIFPSKLESFGLPLLEAADSGLPVLAPELDYVRDVVDPVQTFDPNSPNSIARAVLRHLKVNTPKVRPINAATFLSTVLTQADA